jgi:hypothetical protein
MQLNREKYRSLSSVFPIKFGIPKDLLNAFGLECPNIELKGDSAG